MPMTRRLVETGELGLEDLVRPFLGDDLPLIDDAVTIEHLLIHASGIGDHLEEEGDRTNVLHLPVRGNGDGRMSFTADDLNRFWSALVEGRIVSPGTLAEMIRPRFDVPSEHMRHGMGSWLGRRNSSLILEGSDAGASFRSTYIPETRTTVTVLGNSSEGAWPVIYAFADAMDGTVRGKFADET